jgi:hypothetical protein
MKILHWMLGFACSMALMQPVLADPPGRAFRVATIEGHAQVRNLQEDTRGEIGVNWTVGAGYALSTERFSKTELRVGSSIFRLDEESELEILQLDDQRLQLRLNYGGLAVQISNPAMLAQLIVDTPQGRLQWQEVGRSRIQVWPRSSRSSLNVFSGKVQYAAGANQISVRAGHQVEYFGDDVSTNSASLTEFDRWGESRDLAQVISPETLRYVSSETTGYEELDRQGYWRDSSQYGMVWTPNSRDWMPYRQGHWEWVSPWGWTWVDGTPWAYVTSHYGRWAWLDSRWCWVPGQHNNRPTWSPALVGWISNGQTLHSPVPHGKVSWFPLGPREAWIPWYASSPQYVHRVNQYYVPNLQVGQVYAPNHYQYVDRLNHGRHDQFVRPATVTGNPRPYTPPPPQPANNTIRQAVTQVVNQVAPNQGNLPVNEEPRRRNDESRNTNQPATNAPRINTGQFVGPQVAPILAPNPAPNVTAPAPVRVNNPPPAVVRPAAPVSMPAVMPAPPAAPRVERGPAPEVGPKAEPKERKPREEENERRKSREPGQGTVAK